MSTVRCQVSRFMWQVSGLWCQVSGVSCQVSGVRKRGPSGQPNVPGGLNGSNELFWSRGFKIGVTLDDLMTFLKSGGLGGTLKRFREPMRKPGI